MTLSNQQAAPVIFDLIQTIQANKQYLSDIDGAIGDGDHGINMNKGFTLCQEELQKNPGATLGDNLKTLGTILMTQIGGSMGPLYGKLFRAMAKTLKSVETIDAAVFGQMISAARAGIAEISEAKPGDKTLMDVLVPADEACCQALNAGESFAVCLEKMAQAARTGRDATRDMVARLGRSSRLGERSRGVIDAGAASCCLILETLARSFAQIMQKVTSMDSVIETAYHQAFELLRQSGFLITAEERDKLALNDFGLGDLRKEGFAFIDILRSPRVRITLIILLPGQTLPQHVHPPYNQETGKEETIRCLWGQTRVYLPGPVNNPDLMIPAGKEQYYTARHELPLDPGQHYSVQPETQHWFQGGPDGSVNICFQNRVDETRNIFADPGSGGCPIKPTDK